MSLAGFIAFRYSRSGTKQSFVAFINLFSIIGITLGIASLIIVLSVMNGLEGQLKTRILGILPHIVVDAQKDIPSLTENFSQLITQLPYAESELIVQSRRHVSPVFAQGTDIENSKAYSIVAANTVSGSYDSIKSGSFNISISRILAAKLEVNIGDKLRLISTSTSVHSVFGVMPSQRLATISHVFSVNSEMDDKAILIHIDDLARLNRKQKQDIEQRRLYLRDAFEFRALADYFDKNNYQYSTWRERQGPLFDAVKMEKNMMSLMLLLVIVVAAFNVVSALVMVVSEKKADIAILQTQGMPKHSIMKIFLFNGIFNGLKGVFAGIGLGLLSCWLLNDFLALIGSDLQFGENGQGLPVDIQIKQLLFIALSSIFVCLLASWYPAYKAQAISPANSLRSE